MKIRSLEMEQSSGMLYTHADCPYCYSGNEYEGDIKCEVVECCDCGKEFETN